MRFRKSCTPVTIRPLTESIDAIFSRCLHTKHSLLTKVQPKLAAYCRGRFLQGAQRDGRVVRVQETVECGAAGMHPASHLRFGEISLLHSGFDLPGENALDCGCAHFLINALLAEPAIEG